MENMFNGMFGKIKPGMCKYSMDGRIAIKTSTGYKTYDVKTNHLVNCDNFAFDFGEDFFFIIPTNKVDIGDIILVNGKPNAVIGKNGNIIKVFSYENSTINELVPESHMFMGNTYFYGKIVSLFNGKFGDKNMMKMMLMSQMMGGNGNLFSGNTNNSNNMLPMLMMMNGGINDLFDGMFDEALGTNAKEEGTEEA